MYISFTPARKFSLVIALVFLAQVFCIHSTAQMRQVYVDTFVAENHIKNMSFYSPSEGYVAFSRWIGYTTDSGHSFVKKYITLGNVDFGSYSVNFTFGFAISGVKAFNQSNIIVYGDYALVPAILYSTNGGDSYTLVFHSSYSPSVLSGPITGMVFPQNNNIGFAVDADRILKTTNGGISWTVNKSDPGRLFSGLEAVDNNNVFAFSTDFNTNALLKTTNGGTSWSQVTLPSGLLNYAFFRTASTGWVTTHSPEGVYKTTNGGSSWSLVNHPEATPFSSLKMKFTDDNTGYATVGLYEVYKTTDGGAIWEPLPRDNNYTYLNFYHNDLHFWNNNQFWAGGHHGLLELTTNAGGTTLPKAYFRIDTSGFAATGSVNLVNYSKTGYTYKWYRNDTLISTSYHASYNHYLYSTLDSVKLVVSNGTYSDSLTKYQGFHPPVIIYSFTPSGAAAGNTVTITGINFTGAGSVSFGGVPASSYNVVSSTTITAVVGAGASGSVKVTTPTGTASLAGFTFIPPPTITSFTPLSAAAGATVTITGTNFISVTAVRFAGINAASFTVVSPTTITAIAPSGPSGQVSVTTPGGTASLGGYASIPSITSFTPLQGTHGTIMTITGTSLLETTGITIGGVAVQSFTVNSAASITAEVGTGSTGDVVVTKASGSASLAGFTWYPPPVITSFSPQSGPVGTTVTITGTGFHSNATSNIVYFGTVRATVTGGSTTSLTVTVPPGASYQPVSVVTNNLIGYSAKSFLVTFPNGGSITSATFSAATEIPLGAGNAAINVTSGDFDGDGKTDLAVSHVSTVYANRGVFIFRNTSTTSAVSFDNPINLNNIEYKGAGVGDLDADGKMDLVVMNYASIVTFRNVSTPGTISFIPGGTFPCGSGELTSIAIGDADGDGKADVVVNDGNIHVMRNTSEPGAISFAPKVTYSNMVRARNLLLTDIDGDSKPEIIAPGADVTIMKNNCTKTNISFAAAFTSPGNFYACMASGDIDGDGKTDLVGGNYNGLQVDIFRNTSTPGNISMAPKFRYYTASNTYGIGVSDLDGDGKPDIAAGLYDFQLAAIKNISTPGNLALAPLVGYTSGNFSTEPVLAIADINNDGKDDVITFSDMQPSMIVHINEADAEPCILSFTPTIGESGTTVTINGTNFTGATAVSFGGVPAASFVVNSATSITAVVGAGATGNVVVTNSAGSSSLGEFVYGFAPVITAFSPASGPAGTTVTINGTHFGATPEDNIVYFGGLRAKVLSASSTSMSVVVPFGSMYEPICVTRSGLTAYSRLPFVTTFAGGGGFSNNSFAPMHIWTNGGGTGSISDIDGDKKPDWIFSATAGIGIAANSSISGHISFRPAVYFGSGNGATCGDIDGDGKTDIVSSIGDRTISVLRNTSTPGAIGFDPRKDFDLGSGPPQPSDITIHDIDGDGKPEIITANYGGRDISIFRNTGSAGNITFAPRMDYYLGYYGQAVSFSDIDGDGRPEMITGALEAFNVFRNTSTPGRISFDDPITVLNADGRVSIGDLDNDGKPDLIIAHSQKLSVYRNTSTSGNISFNAPVDHAVSNASKISAIDDMDGDGKADIFITLPSLQKIAVVKNNSTPGNIALSAPVAYEIAETTNATIAADLDGDGKADIINYHSGGIRTILRNQVAGNGPSIISLTPASAVAGATIVIRGNNFNGATEVSFGGTAANSFTVVNADSITAVLGNGASGDVVVKTPSGVASLAGFVYGSSPLISHVSPTAATPGTPVMITGGNFTGATSVQFGGTAAASFSVISPTTISALPAGGAAGDITVTTPSGTASYSGFSLFLPPSITSYSPINGSGGFTATITGENLSGAFAVSFGGVAAASFTVVSPTTITAVIPGAGASGDVRVETPGGVATKSGFFFQSTPIVNSFYPTTAATGSTVIITGWNIGAATSVKFGGTEAASFTVTSPSTITAVVGAGSSGNVSVSNSWGTGNLAGFTFAGSTPSISRIIPAIAGPGTIVTISGDNFNGATAVSFGGSAATSFTVVSPNTITAVVGSGASGDVSVITPGGTTAFSGFIYTNAPVVTSFTPVSARPGMPVTIAGYNFSSVASSNIVYFGNVRATVTAASATSLTVTVPGGSVLAPLSVTTSGLTGYSAKAFLPTFAGSGITDPKTFVVRMDSASAVGPSGLSLPDVNMDGKPDLVIANDGIYSTLTSNLTVYANSSSPAVLSFAPRVTLPNIFGPQRINAADFNGDGKLDLLTGNRGDGNALSVYPNTGTTTAVSFDAPVILSGTLGEFNATTGDFDGDGKPDIAFVGRYANTVYLYRNTSSGTTISFAPRTSVGASGYPRWIEASDFDGDGKTDLLVSGDGGPKLLYRNTSSPGNISFAVTSFNFYHGSTSLAIADMDGDGKTDIVMANEGMTDNQGGVAVVRNVSIPGVFQFEQAKTFSAGNNPARLALADIDGNGLPDIIAASSVVNTVSVLSNRSSVGQLAFDHNTDFPTSCPTTFIAAADIDSDGKPDIVTANYRANSVTVFKSLQPAEAVNTLSLCAGGSTNLTSNITGVSYQWMQNAGSGFVAVTNNSNHSGATTASLQLTNVPASWNNYDYKCMVTTSGGILLSSQLYRLHVSASTPASVVISGTTTVTQGQQVAITAAPTGGGSNPAYQWQDSTHTHTWQNIAGATSASLNYTPHQTGDKIRCLMTSNASCASPVPATSNVLVFTVNPVTAVDPVPASGYGIRLYPNPVTGSFYIDTLKLTDRWQTLEIMSIDGKNRVMVKNIVNQARVQVTVSGLPPGLYIALLRRKSGEVAYLKFVKQ